METKLQSLDDLASTFIWTSYDLKCCFVMANSRGSRHPGKLLLLKSLVNWHACIQYFNIQVSDNKLRESSNLCCLTDCLLTFTDHQEQGSFAFFHCFVKKKKKMLICRKVQTWGIHSPTQKNPLRYVAARCWFASFQILANGWIKLNTSYLWATNSWRTAATKLGVQTHFFCHLWAMQLFSMIELARFF